MFRMGHGLRWRRRTTRALAIAVMLVASMAPAAFADGDPDAAEEIVSDHCAICHKVPGLDSSRRPGWVYAPSFLEMAEQPRRYTTTRIRDFLAQPHYPMTRMILSESDIENLLAYIERMRK